MICYSENQETMEQKYNITVYLMLLQSNKF